MYGWFVKKRTIPPLKPMEWQQPKGENLNMTQPVDTLLPCPFCNGEPYISGSGDFVGCYACGAMMSEEMLQDSIIKWNTRHAQPDREEMVRRMRELYCEGDNEAYNQAIDRCIEVVRTTPPSSSRRDIDQ